MLLSSTIQIVGLGDDEVGSLIGEDIITKIFLEGTLSPFKKRRSYLLGSSIIFDLLFSIVEDFSLSSFIELDFYVLKLVLLFAGFAFLSIETALADSFEKLSTPELSPS